MRNIQWIWFCMCGSVSACASSVFSCIEHRLRTNAYLLKLKLSTNSLAFCFYCLWNTNKNKQKHKTKVSTFWQIPFFHFPFTYAYSTPETAALFHVSTLKKHEYNSHIPHSLSPHCWRFVIIIGNVRSYTYTYPKYIHTYVHICVCVHECSLYSYMPRFTIFYRATKNASVQFISVAVYVCFICFLRFGPLAFRVLRVCVSVCAFCLIFFSITFVSYTFFFCLVFFLLAFSYPTFLAFFSHSFSTLRPSIFFSIFTIASEKFDVRRRWDRRWRRRQRYLKNKKCVRRQ